MTQKKKASIHNPKNIRLTKIKCPSGFKVSSCLAGFALHILTAWWLSPTHLKNMSWSIGVMTFPRYGK